MQFDDFYGKPSDALKERRLREYHDLFIGPFFPKDKNIRVLDLACGYGVFLRACKNSGYRNIYGVDFNADAVQYATKDLGLENVTKDDVFAYLERQSDHSIDVIVAANFVEHVKKELVPRLLTLIYSKLKKDGIFISEVPNADSIHGVHTFFSDLTHEWAYTKALMTQLLVQAGFAQVKVYPNRIRSNKLIRIAQKLLTKIVSGDDKLQYAGSIITVARKL